MRRTTTVAAVTVLALILTFGCARNVHAEDYYVDDSVSESGNGKTRETAFKYIQEAIDTSTNGDTITVAKGIYFENIFFDGKNIILQSTNPHDWQTVEDTIIDGNQDGSVVTFAGTEDETCTLRGFTIRDGNGRNGGGICGGEYDGNKTAATIENNLIENNESNWSGGGIAFCDGLIFSNIVRDNFTLVEGAGLAYCDGWIEGNAILHNSCTATIELSSGAGLYSCNGVIQTNLIAENKTGPRGGFGGGLSNCDGSINANKIYNNISEYGGAMSYCDGIFQNNLVYSNMSDILGGALVSCDALILTNNIIAHNKSGRNSGGIAYCNGEIQNCILYNNIAEISDAQVDHSSTPTYSCIQDWTDGGEGNISQNPRFINPENGDFRLSPDSPCIDAGKNEEWMQNAKDFSGNPRILYGKNALTVDMGAHEYFKFGIVDIKRGPHNTQLTWTSLPQKVFIVWSLENIADGVWKKEAEINAGGVLSSWVDNALAPGRKFYKVEMR